MFEELYSVVVGRTNESISNQLENSNVNVHQLDTYEDFAKYAHDTKWLMSMACTSDPAGKRGKHMWDQASREFEQWYAVVDPDGEKFIVVVEPSGRMKIVVDKDGERVTNRFKEQYLGEKPPERKRATTGLFKSASKEEHLERSENELAAIDYLIKTKGSKFADAEKKFPKAKVNWAAITYLLEIPPDKWSEYREYWRPEDEDLMELYIEEHPEALKYWKKR